VPSRNRRYAGFFQFPRKDWSELSIVEELIVSLEREGFDSLHDPKTFSPDPPDVICLDSIDLPVAVEVVEAVSQEAVALNAQGRRVTKWWDAAEFVTHVCGLILTKDAKTFNGGPFQRKIVCVHTDEPVVMPDEVRIALAAIPPMRLNQIAAAYLLFSYDPGTQSYPVLRIPVAT
jgi:hypothetical protein